MYNESGRGSSAIVVDGSGRGWIVTCAAAMDLGRVVVGEVFGSGIVDEENGS